MLGLPRRSAATRCTSFVSTSTASVLRARATPSLIAAKDFHSSQPHAAFSPTWMPRRVKTPWIEALTKSREDAKTAEGAGTPPAKPDLTPKKMSDSYYSVVCAHSIACQCFVLRMANAAIGASPGAG